MALISHRFHDLIIRIIEDRLLKAASLGAHTLILGVSHPTTNASYLFCQYLGHGGPTRIEDTLMNCDSTGRLRRLSTIYSHFRPLLPENDSTIPRLQPSTGLLIGQLGDITQIETGYTCQDIHLESHELFSQLCTSTKLVKVSKNLGLLQTLVDVSDGVIRIWRNWLDGRCAAPSRQSADIPSGSSHTLEDNEDEYIILWADNKEHVGLRMGVEEKESLDQESIANPNEDRSVSYTLQFEGMVLAYLDSSDTDLLLELVIRATQLLLAVEQSFDQEAKYSRRTTVFAF